MKIGQKKPRVLIDSVTRSLGTVVQERETTSLRILAKRRNPYRWCFCELCWRSTEWETADEARLIFKRLHNGNAKAIPLTDAIRDEAQKEADLLVERYEQALAGKFGPYEAVRMIFTYCDVQEMRGDRSVAAFCDQVERRSRIATWARHGDLLSVSRLPNQPGDAPRPSKLYCEAHNPRRSIEARRAYQRDRRFTAEYEELISTLWSLYAHELPTWDIDAHAEVRREAYRQLQAMKSPTSKAVQLLVMGTMNQTEIAQQLRVSRQAVSAAIKRRHARTGTQ